MLVAPVVALVVVVQALLCDNASGSGACSTEEAATAGGSSTRVLNANRRVFSVDDFMSSTEIEHVIAVATAHFTDDMGGSEAWRTADKYMSTELRSWADDPVLRTIEARVARMVRIPVHAAESSIMVGYTPPPRRPVTAGSALPRRLLANVHHDKNTAPGRVMTALVYLTDVIDGGQTVFPCHGSDENGTESVTITNLRERFAEAYLANKRILFPPSDRDCFDAQLFAQTEALCNERGALALTVQPKKGRALFFASVQPDGSSDPTMWHGGCALGPGDAGGQGKWTLQKFREFPPRAPLRAGFQSTGLYTVKNASEWAQHSRSLLRTRDSGVPVDETIGRGCGGEAHEMRCEENLFRWARANGAYISDGIIASPGDASTGGRGLIAVGGLQAGAIAFRIPRWLQMTYAHACQSKLVIELGKHRQAAGNARPLCPNLVGSRATRDMVPAVVVLGLYLLLQRNLGEDSVWWPYIAALPASYTSAGLAFTDADLPLLDGTVIAHQFLQSLRALHSNHNDLRVLTAELRQLLLVDTDLAKPLGLRSTEAGPGWEERWGADACEWAIGTVRSRSWDDENPHSEQPAAAETAIGKDGVDAVQDSPRDGATAPPGDHLSEGSTMQSQRLSGPALVPIADLANHGSGGNLLGQTAELARQLRVGSTRGLPTSGAVTDRYQPTSHWVSHEIQSSDRRDSNGTGRREFGSLVPLAAVFGVFDSSSYVLPITLMSDDAVSDRTPGTARHMLWEYGCMAAGFLPLGRTGEDGFTERLLACLRLDCMGEDEASVSMESKAAGLALMATKGVTANAGTRMVGAASEVERCATRKALLQLSEALSYYNDGPDVSEDTASLWPSLAEETDMLAWLAAEGAGRNHTGVVGPWAALQGRVNISSILTRAATAGKTTAWDRTGLALQAQRRREWLLVSLRRWEHAAYAAAYDEAVKAAQAAASQQTAAKTSASTSG